MCGTLATVLNAQSATMRGQWVGTLGGTVLGAGEYMHGYVHVCNTVRLHSVT